MPAPAEQVPLLSNAILPSSESASSTSTSSSLLSFAMAAALPADPPPTTVSRALPKVHRTHVVCASAQEVKKPPPPRRAVAPASIPTSATTLRLHDCKEWEEWSQCRILLSTVIDLREWTQLETLDISGCCLPLLPLLPRSLRTLKAAHNGFDRLPALPRELRVLHLDGNPLVELPPLPPHLEELSLRDCGLQCLSEDLVIPATLRTLDLSNTLPLSPFAHRRHNRLRHMPQLPDTLETVLTSFHPLTPTRLLRKKTQ